VRSVISGSVVLRSTGSATIRFCGSIEIEVNRLMCSGTYKLHLICRSTQVKSMKTTEENVKVL
jgi:hypothetical protein